MGEIPFRSFKLGDVSLLVQTVRLNRGFLQHWQSTCCGTEAHHLLPSGGVGPKGSSKVSPKGLMKAVQIDVKFYKFLFVEMQF